MSKFFSLLTYKTPQLLRIPSLRSFIASTTGQSDFQIRTRVQYRLLKISLTPQAIFSFDKLTLNQKPISIFKVRLSDSPHFRPVISVGRSSNPTSFISTDLNALMVTNERIPVLYIIVNTITISYIDNRSAIRTDTDHHPI